LEYDWICICYSIKHILWSYEFLELGLTNFLNQQGLEFPWQVIASIMLLISGFFDIVDGSVARVMKKTTTRGAFLDSNFDKVSEALIFIAIAIGG
jgi:phosphatidylglycerophosphate synthase